MVEHDDEIKVLGEINVELESGTYKLIKKLSKEKVSQEEALDKFNSMVGRDKEIKVLGEVNVELESSTNKLIDKLSQEKDSQDEVLEDSALDNVLDKLSQEKDSPDDFYYFMYDTDDDASISRKSSEHFGWDWPEKDSPDVMEIANDQAEALSDQEVVNDCFDDEKVEERRPSKRIRVTQEETVNDENPKKG
ncbi:hypothetical protein Tco_0763545 [Tanacetum coccineum]